MNRVLSSEKEILLAVEEIDQSFMNTALRFPYYTVIFIAKGNGTYFADIGRFSFSGPTLLFSTPMQKLAILQEQDLKGYVIHFHSDFYCIEYHKAQVACNGLLFNNIYIEPSVLLTAEQGGFFSTLCADVIKELAVAMPDVVVLRSYLQLFLAKSSNIKLQSMESPATGIAKDEQMEAFMTLMERNYLTLHKPADYAKLLAMPPNTLSKKCQQYFKKSPSEMIHERLVLEAKKKLHLTRQNIKEIAFSLNFSDEYYFSRFFKKFTNISPQGYRESVGISIVAEMID